MEEMFGPMDNTITWRRWERYCSHTKYWSSNMYHQHLHALSKLILQYWLLRHAGHNIWVGDKHLIIVAGDFNSSLYNHETARTRILRVFTEAYYKEPTTNANLTTPTFCTVVVARAWLIMSSEHSLDGCWHIDALHNLSANDPLQLKIHCRIIDSYGWTAMLWHTKTNLKSPSGAQMLVLMMQYHTTTRR